MSKARTTRRKFLKVSAGSVAVGVAVPYFYCSETSAKQSKNDRPILGAIGVGGRGSGDGRAASGHGDMVAVCDVDRQHAERFKGKSKMEIYKDYRKLLDRKDIQAVTIGTPDHWHTPIALYALQAGKDVYCEKPLTLTIDEGKMICKAVKQTGRVFQVGTQQRTEMGQKFLKAVAIAQSGRLGKIKKVTVSIGGAPNSGPFKSSDPPPHLDWDFWLGQTPKVPYTKQRCHGTFRWWYEYSGGKMTDWGAHHVDIAQWAIGMNLTGPTSVEPLMSKHPDHANRNGFNTATQFRIKCTFPNGVEMIVQHAGNGILFEGDKNRIYVNRGKLTGKPVEEIQKSKSEQQWLAAEVAKFFNGRNPSNHMANFFMAVKDRKQPISDVFTHHRALTTCHLCNLAIRLNRTLKWDADKQQIVGDSEANSWLKRKQRKGYEFTG